MALFDTRCRFNYTNTHKIFEKYHAKPGWKPIDMFNLCLETSFPMDNLADPKPQGGTNTIKSAYDRWLAVNNLSPPPDTSTPAPYDTPQVDWKLLFPIFQELFDNGLSPSQASIEVKSTRFCGSNNLRYRLVRDHYQAWLKEKNFLNNTGDDTEDLTCQSTTTMAQPSLPSQRSVVSPLLPSPFLSFSMGDLSFSETGLKESNDVFGVGDDLYGASSLQHPALSRSVPYGMETAEAGMPYLAAAIDSSFNTTSMIPTNFPVSLPASLTFSDGRDSVSAGPPRQYESTGSSASAPYMNSMSGLTSSLRQLNLQPNEWVNIDDPAHPGSGWGIVALEFDVGENQ